MFIEVKKVIQKKNRVEIVYDKSDDLSEYFNEVDFFYEYNEDIEEVPEAIAVIPFVTNVLPIIWLFDAELRVPELDKTFYESIPKFKEGYVNMYPEADFKGNVIVSRLVDCSYRCSERVTAFYSGGLDAVHTLMRHLSEKPDLITIYGSDLNLGDEEGWKRVQDTVSEAGKKYGLKNVYIKSSFASFIKERALSYRFMEVIHGFWYHNIQHGIGMLGLVAPYAYKYRIKTHYIASSYDSATKKIECASDPSIDNELRFGSCSIIHDAFGFSRQSKIADVIKRGGVKLRVCWSVKDGNNCCHCEKCYRTMAGIIVEGADPIRYGFDIDKNTLKRLKRYMTIGYQCDNVSMHFWEDIQKKFCMNRKMLKGTKYYDDIKWIGSFDFSNLKFNKEYKLYILKNKILSIICKIIPRNMKNRLKRFINIYE